MSEFVDSSTITRGKILGVDDTARGQVLEVEGYNGERFSKVLRAQSHGFSSHPPIGAVGQFLRLGSSDRLVALGFENETRPVSAPGGSAVLYDASGNTIFAKSGEGVKVRAKAGGIEVEADTGTISFKRGDMQVSMGPDRAEIGLAGGLKVVLTPGRVDLGGEGGQRVMTAGGLSTKVFAIL